MRWGLDMQVNKVQLRNEQIFLKPHNYDQLMF